MNTTPIQQFKSDLEKLIVNRASLKEKKREILLYFQEILMHDEQLPEGTQELVEFIQKIPKK